MQTIPIFSNSSCDFTICTKYYSAVKNGPSNVQVTVVHDEKVLSSISNIGTAERARLLSYTFAYIYSRMVA